MSERFALPPLLLLGLAAALTAGTAVPKIHPRVLERAQSEPVIPVFIVLEHQPQREIFERVESANAMYRQVAESRYQQASGAEELRQAREAEEAVVLRTRQQAFQEIEQAIGPEQDALEGRLRGLGATRISRYLGINMLTAEIPASAIGALEADPSIAHVFPVEKQYPQLATSVPALGAPAFWNAGYTGQGESVGILDSGVRTNHPAFAGVSINSQVLLTNGATDPCFADNASSGEDQYGHGTHVAGIVASQGSAGWTNYQGVVKGIGTLYNLKVGYKLKNSSDCDAGAESDPRDVLAALDWAVAKSPLKIFNYSYGSPTDDDDDGFTQSIDQYIDNYGLTITIAAGNGGPSYYGVTSPGVAYNSITVANWASRGTIDDSSSRGPTSGGRYKPDVAAPGTDIYSTAYDWDAHSGTSDDFVSGTGTSMAAPHIAGAAALLESAGVANSLAVKALLINTADSSGPWASDSGWGYTNLNTAYAQLNYATGSLSANDLQLYRLSGSGALRVTAAWNRHISGSDSYLNGLGLSLCSVDTGAQLASSAATIQNVEQLSSAYTGDVVLAVAMTTSPLTGVSSEPYAVAFSSPGTPLPGHPTISPLCSAPGSTASGAQLPLTCTVTNSGSAPALAVAGQATLPAGFSGAAQGTFGDVQPGFASSRVFNLTAPTVSGTYLIRFDVGTLCGRFVGATTLTTTVYPALPVPVLVSPANGATGVSQTPTLSWNASPGAASYDVYLGTSTPPPLVTNIAATSYAPGGLTPGTLYYWRIVAKNGSGSSSSATWAFTTLTSLSGPQQYLMVTVAGNRDIQSPLGDGGPATSANLYLPLSVAVDAAGSYYIADNDHSLVRKVAPDGIITTVAGGGLSGNLGDGGPAVGAYLSNPFGVAVDGAGNLYIADFDAQRIRKVTPGGTITTAVGNGVRGYSEDGGPATSAEIDSPFAVAADAAGELYFDDVYPLVRKVGLDGVITTIVGSKTAGYSGDGGPAVNAQLNNPAGLALDAAGNLYIADLSNNRIRKVTPNGIITTVAGNGTPGYSGDGGPATNAQLNGPEGVAVDAAGNLYIADTSNYRIRKVTANGNISTVAGNGTEGYAGDGWPATSGEFDIVESIAVTAGGYLYLADPYNNVVRALVLQDPSCRYRVDQAVVAVSGAGGSAPISIHTTPSCSWGALGLPSWISGNPAGVGSATVNLVVAPNSGTLRTATISIAGSAVTVVQGEAISACTYALSPGFGSFNAGGGAGSITVVTGPDCPWVASNATDWVTLAEPTYGIGGGSVGYAVAPDTGVARSGTLIVAGLDFTVQQGTLSGNGLRFVPVAPCRVADTRFAGPSMAANSTRSFAVPQSGCGIPSTAQAYSLNVTVVPQGPLSYLTLWPTGLDQPLVSTLNSWGGIVVANAAIVPAGTDGAVSVYVTNPTDVILDINGYFDSSSGAGSYSFYPAQPCRVADTRGAAGPFGGPSLSGDQSRDFPVPSSSCGLPSTASAYSMNVTVVPAGYLGYLTTWPTGQAQPNVSTLNSWTGKVVANAAIVPAGTSGFVSVYVSNPTAVILDTNGYFGAPGGAGALNFYPVAPCRVADTRGATGPLGGPEMEAATTRSFPIPSSACGIPAAAAAYSVNVTVVPDEVLSYLTAWPAGSVQPFVSTLNSWDGAVVANAAIVPAGASGAISVYVTDRTHVILDINGYFAP